MQKILIIEDDDSISNLEKDYLEVNNFEVKVIRDGIMGMNEFENGGYSLVIVDLMLPNIDGFEIVKKIRQKDETPVLIVSAKKDDIDKIRGFGLGADDYITKPFSPSELVARVKAHILKYERMLNKLTNKAEVIVIGSIEIQKSARRVFVLGKEVVLAQKEFELLMFLMENPNILFNRDQLFEKIWGFESLGDSATVTVHIGRIRDKIEIDPSKPQYIETVWGAGYRFNS